MFNDSFSRKLCLLRDVVEKYTAARQATNDNIVRRKHFPCWMDT